MNDTDRKQIELGLRITTNYIHDHYELKGIALDTLNAVDAIRYKLCPELTRSKPAKWCDAQTEAIKQLNIMSKNWDDDHINNYNFDMDFDELINAIANIEFDIS